MVRGRVLTVGLLDGIGDDGIILDQKVLAAHGCDAAIVNTALLYAKNPAGSHVKDYTPPDAVDAQLDSIVDKGVDVIKTGWVFWEKNIRFIAEKLQQNKGILSVVEAHLIVLQDEGRRTFKDKLLPRTTVLVAGWEEASLLLAHEKFDYFKDVKRVARSVHLLGPRYVFLIDTEKAILVGENQELEIESDSLRSNRAARESIASAIAANLANGLEVTQAVQAAVRYVEACVQNSVNGQLDYFHSTYKLPFSPGHFVDYILQRPDAKEAWKRHTEHEFVARLGDGTLPLEAFKDYLIQDYLFLVQFARANALAAYKEKDLDNIVRSAQIILHINREMGLHLSYCKDFGLEKEDILKVPESQACTAYTRYVLDTGNSEDWFALQVALSPCLIGYGVIARKLYDDPKTVREGNRYWKWIQNYVADDYTEAVTLGRDLLEKHAQKQSPSRIEELVKIFIHATNMETGFWDMGYGKK